MIEAGPAGRVMAEPLLGQAFAALGPAAIDHGLAAAGFHPAQKSVGAFSSKVVGLEGHFHDITII